MTTDPAAAQIVLRVASPDDPEYLRLSRAEADFWRTAQPFGVEAQADERGPIQAYTNERFTGDRDVKWYETIAQYGAFRRGLFIGTGGLKQDARILSDLPELNATFVDLSEASLARWEQELGAQFPGRVTTQVADLNFLDLSPNTYDLVVSSGTFHHVSNLERLATQTNSALTAGGYFFLQDYVGEAYHRLSDDKKRVFEALSDRWRPPGRQSGTIWTNEDASSRSPFCGVRSDEILPVLAEHLTQERLRTAGAMVALLMYSRPSDPCPPVARRSFARRAATAALRRFARMSRSGAQSFLSPAAMHELLLLDAIICDSEMLLPSNAFAIYRKRQ